MAKCVYCAVMSVFGHFLKKLSERGASKEPFQIYESDVNDSCSLQLSTDQIRILLFRECELRGRKLVFDSVSTGKVDRAESAVVDDRMPTNCEESKRKSDMTDTTSEPTHKAKNIGDDANLLSEMVFGTVAMAYKGPSFKIHSINSPRCLIFTKVFPDSEHIVCRQREKYSDEALGHLNSSSGSLKTERNVSGNSLNLSPGIRKSSTCSSTGSNCTADASPSGSSQTMDHSSSSSIGSSLSSLRKRWLKMKSTSFNQFDCDELFGNHSDSSLFPKEGQRHKTRLGLAMQIERQLFEHVALLEGILDRLRCCCIESKKNRDGKSEADLIKRLDKATTYRISWLLQLFMDQNNSNFYPLLWHDIFMCSNISRRQRFQRLHRCLEQMCRLLIELDSKSTNFFLSTLVTAILTHHLGWIHTVAPRNNQNLLKEWKKRYLYNPLWAQLIDLYGALGNPTKTVQTVITGSSDKKSLINSTLTFASYFLRSSVVEKKSSCNYCPEEDVEKAVKKVDEASKLSRLHVENLESSANTIAESRIRSALPRMKRSGTFHKDLDKYSLGSDLKSGDELPLLNDCEDHFPSSMVKIVVSTIPHVTDSFTQLPNTKHSLSLGNLERLKVREPNEAFKMDESKWSSDVSSNIRPFHSSEDLLSRERRRSVLFMLGDEEKPLKLCKSCERAKYEDMVLETADSTNKNVTCERCGKSRVRLSRNNAKEGAKLSSELDELPHSRSDSLEHLLRDNYVIELPMSRIKQESMSGNAREEVGFTKTLLKKKVKDLDENYTWGMVMQGFIRKRMRRKKARREETKWWEQICKEVVFDAKFSVLDQPIDETFSILADLDAYKIELLSNKLAIHDLPLPVGMSRLVSNMLEAFVHIWKRYHSPEHCVRLLESRLREMWLRSETLAQLLLVSNFGDITLDKLTEVLDSDAADLPLLLAVATTHTPQIAQSFGLSFV